MVAFDANYAKRRLQRLGPPILQPAKSYVNITYDPGQVPDTKLPMAYDDSGSSPKPLAPASACVNMVYDPDPGRTILRR